MSSHGPSDTTILDSLQEQEIVSCLGSSSAAMVRCLHLAEAVAGSRVPVLITGETGAGKSLMARHIHNLSPRRARPCLVLKCAGLREREIKTRLFGSSDPSRSGGLLGEAGGGTLVLDGVEHMSGFVQKELLQILRESSREAQTPEEGSGTARRLGARLISTGRGGALAGASGTLMEELLFGLGEVVIRIPPLRERREDVEQLTIRALRSANRVHGKKVMKFARSAREFMRHYPFPGNLRELFYIVNRAVRDTTRDTLYVEDFGEAAELRATGVGSPIDTTLLSLAELEKRHLRSVLLRTGWKRAAAARILHLSQATLDRKIRLHGLERDQ